MAILKVRIRVVSGEPPVHAGWVFNALFFSACLLWPAACLAQQPKRKRATPPEFSESFGQGVFFENPAAQITGKLSASTGPELQPKSSAAASTPASSPEARIDQAGDPRAWHKLISAVSVEDLVKGSKLRLERIVTSPSAYASGGFADARREFSLQALLFAIVEVYPSEDVRWKASAAVAKEKMARNAANAQVGSIQSFRAAKTGLLDLADLVNGSPLSGTANAELNWSQLIDRGPLMQLMEWSQQEYVNPLSASSSKFAEGKDELRRYAELLAVLGKASIEPEMPDATDEDYRAFATQLIDHSRTLVAAVQSNDPELARKAAAQLGQSCQNCHDNFR
ncbi:MAG: cytochrome c [bacterium]|nr:cytochrome c [bacterium]